MADIVWTDVTAFAPQLTTVDAGAQTDILAHVNALLDVDQFDGESGPTTRLARIYLAAHVAASVQQGASGSAGPVTSEKVGDLARSYGFSGFLSFSALEGTAYGRLYKMLLSTSNARGPRVL